MALGKRKKGNEGSVNDVGTDKVLIADQYGNNENIEFKESEREDTKRQNGRGDTFEKGV